MIHYGVTKTMPVALARGLAEATAGTNVTVNSVLVGPTRSEGIAGFVSSMAEAKGVSVEQVEKDFFATVRPGSLLKRFITTEEVAAMVAFLAARCLQRPTEPRSAPRAAWSEPYFSPCVIL